MKRLFLIMMSMCLPLVCLAQNDLQLQMIVPLENYREFMETRTEIPDGIYFKDVNHVLDKYVGEWTATYDDKSYKFYITKKIGSISSTGTIYDELRIRYDIFNDSGVIIASNVNLSDDNVYMIEGELFRGENNKYYTAYYQGKHYSICGDSGVLYLEMTNASDTEMSLFIDPDEALFTSADCPNGYVAPPFPQEDEPAMILTKVE